MNRPPAPSVTIVALTMALALAACSSGGDDTVVRDDVVTVPAPVNGDAGDGSDDLFTPDGDAGGGTGEGSGDLGPVPPPLPTDVATQDLAELVVESIEPVPDTGVPGIDSDDAFCRSWSEFAGSYQALTFSWALVGGQPSARLEVMANGALRAAVAQLADALPDELSSERQALTIDLTTPILRRAERSRELLLVEGVDEATIDALSSLWLAALADAGPESDDLTVPIDDGGLDDPDPAARRAQPRAAAR